MFLRLLGVSQLMKIFEGYKDVESSEAWVGSAVIYGPMHEFGTSAIPARPHWRPAVEEVGAQIGSDQGLQGKVMDGLASYGSGWASFEVALMVERRVKEIIAAKGIFDTGNYRGSVATGQSQGGAFSRSASLAIDPDSVAK